MPKICKLPRELVRLRDHLRAGTNDKKSFAGPKQKSFDTRHKRQCANRNNGKNNRDQYQTHIVLVELDSKQSDSTLDKLNDTLANQHEPVTILCNRRKSSNPQKGWFLPHTCQSAHMYNM